MSEPWGFRVQLSSLETFAQTVNEVLNDYATLNGQLAAADPAKREATLLGLAKLPGSKAVDAECRKR